MQDLYPGITDYLESVQAKKLVLEVLQNSKEFLCSLVELCIEIALDK